VYPQALANFDVVAAAVLSTYQETVVEGKHTPQEAVALAAPRARAELKKK
jgi:hypothetical protein